MLFHFVFPVQVDPGSAQIGLNPSQPQIRDLTVEKPLCTPVRQILDRGQVTLEKRDATRESETTYTRQLNPISLCPPPLPHSHPAGCNRGFQPGFTWKSSFLQIQMETFSGLRPRSRWETPLHVVIGICFFPVTQHTQDGPRKESQHQDREGGVAMSSVGGIVRSTQRWPVSANTDAQLRSARCPAGEDGGLWVRESRAEGPLLTG